MNLAQANADRFNRMAPDWDKPEHIERANAVAQAICAAVPLESSDRALEFGCGTGLVTLQLAPHLASITGMDGSDGMLEVLRKKCSDRHIGNVNVLHGNVPADLPEAHFDLVTSTMTLHHVADVGALLRVLFDHLEAGGRVALADLDAENGTFHGDDTGVAHHGFDREAMKRMLTAAGFTSPQLSTAWTIRKEGSDGITRDYPIFLAVAQRPAER